MRDEGILIRTIGGTECNIMGILLFPMIAAQYQGEIELGVAESICTHKEGLGSSLEREGHLLEQVCRSLE